MKARIKATGEIIEVSQGIYSPYQYVGDNGAIYTEEDVEILAPTIDYWTRLEHQYAGMAMQGMLSNAELISLSQKAETYSTANVTTVAMIFAHALVEKYKKEEK